MVVAQLAADTLAFRHPQAILGRHVGTRLVEELAKVPSYSVDWAVLEDGARPAGPTSHVSVRLTIKSTFSPGTRGVVPAVSHAGLFLLLGGAGRARF